MVSFVGISSNLFYIAENIGTGIRSVTKKTIQRCFWRVKRTCFGCWLWPIAHNAFAQWNHYRYWLNPLYVKKYARVDVERNPNGIRGYIEQRARFGVVCSAEHFPFKDSIFDETRCSGLLHHLPTESSLRTIKEMLRCTRPLGKVIIFDNVWPKRPIYRPLAWLTRRCDRGEWVRTEEQLLNLAYTTCDGNWQHRRFTYTFTGLEGIFLTIERPEDY